MKIFDTHNGKAVGSQFSLELTCVPSLWNHRKTVALYFARGEGLPNYGAERSNLCSGTSVMQG